MKRILLFGTLLFSVVTLHAQFEEDFTPNPTGWILSTGARFAQIAGNDVIITPAAGGNNPAMIGTPAVNKTSNTGNFCFDIWAYTANLKYKQAFPCNTFADILFVKSSVNDAKDADMPSNLLARVDNFRLPTNGGNTCLQFAFPAAVTDADFKVFISFHAACNQGGIKYVMDNVRICSVDEVCPGSSCPPTALDDNFLRIDPTELSFNAVLYGSNLNYPAPPAGYVTDAAGTDNDQNDTYTHLKWELVTAPSNGSVTINADGTSTISRNSVLESQVTFVYRVCDDGADNNFATTADNLCDDAAVTVNFPVGAGLPVSLINFSGTRSGPNVTIKWTTTFEGNNNRFWLQRSFGNGVYQTVAYVNSKAVDGNSTIPIYYDYTELNSTNNLSWYRLVQENKDGTVTLNAAKSVRGIDNAAKMLIYPNPGTGENITILFGRTAEREISISDKSGRLVKGWNNYKNDQLIINGLKGGVYMLIVIDKLTRERSVEKIIVLK